VGLHYRVLFQITNQVLEQTVAVQTMGNLVVWIENTFCGMDPYDQMIFN